MNSNPTSEELRKLGQQIRLHTLDMISHANSSHIGSAYSAVEILACLYSGVLKVRAQEPSWPGRDRFIMSKGHACAALYSVLALRGFFPVERLKEFYVDGGTLAGHATHTNVPGLEVSTGSLGHGLALAVGMAAGLARQGSSARVVTLLSDGECDEGSTWEAGLLASAWEVNNLTAIVDYNKIQSLGRVEDILPLEPFGDKWRAFGWDVREVDGHDVDALWAVLDTTSWSAARPRCVIAHTVKGKGVSFMEDDLLWHYRSPQGEEYDRARRELLEGF